MKIYYVKSISVNNSVEKMGMVIGYSRYYLPVTAKLLVLRWLFPTR
jgi:hypothetical protein